MSAVEPKYQQRKSSDLQGCKDKNSGLTRFNGRAQLASPPVQAIPALNFKPKSHCPHFQNTKANQHQPVRKPVPTCNYAYIFSVTTVLNSPENYPLDKA